MIRNCSSIQRQPRIQALADRYGLLGDLRSANASPMNLPLLRAAIDKIANENHLPVWPPENAFDFDAVERA